MHSGKVCSVFNQDEGFRLAIREKRARIEEINLILAQPRQSGTAVGFVTGLIEERLHLEEAVAEAEAGGHQLRLQNADTLFRWEDLDQRLLSPKTSDLAQEMHQRAGEAQRSIAYETAQSGNSAGYLPRWFAFQEQLADEWAERLYAAHCETWTEQNRTISPAFIRAVRDQAIAQLFAARRSSAQHEVELRAVRISDTSNPQTSAAIGEWTRRMSRLAARWNRKLEAEAVACEYRTSADDHGLTGGPIREHSSRPKLIAEHDPLSTRRCAVCHHYECHHDDHGCFLDKDGKMSQGSGILYRSALKKTGAECWCPKFISDFPQAADLIYESGTSEALKQGAEGAITRGDSRNARRLLDQLIIKTPSAARDLDWIKAVERRIAAIEPAVLSPISAGSSKPGRTLTRSADFASFAGKLWLAAKQRSGKPSVTTEQLNQIASSLDEQRYVPPAKYLEGKCARELKEFNSKNSNSKTGPIRTWSELVALGDKDHLRGMRRLLSRCAEKLPV
jgi:hypothetical protein